jgi:hypothetical protein
VHGGRSASCLDQPRSCESNRHRERVSKSVRPVPVPTCLRNPLPLLHGVDVPISSAPPASAAAPLTFLPLRRRALPRLSPSSRLTTRAARHSTFLLDPRDLTDAHCPFLRRMSLDSPAAHVPSKLMPQIWSGKFQLHRFPLPCLASFPAPPLAFPTS